MNTNSRFKKFLDKVLEKWPVKIICLILAIALYLLHQSSLLEKRTFIVPLSVVQEGGVCLVGNNVKSVSVIVRTKKDVIAQIKNSDLMASINITPLTESGVFEVPVNLELSDQVKAYDPVEVKVKPEKLNINVEKIAMKNVPVIPYTVGEVGNGYVIENISIEPAYATIEGPESQVEATNEIQTKRVTVSNAKVNFSTTTEPYELNPQIKLIDKGPYKVTISLTTETGEKKFNNVKVNPINLNDELKLVSELPKVNLVVGGTVPYLSDYELPWNFIVADLFNISEPGIYEIPLRFTSNPNISLQSKSADKVTVTVEYKNPKLHEPVEEENLEDENDEEYEILIYETEENNSADKKEPVSDESADKLNEVAAEAENKE